MDHREFFKKPLIGAVAVVLLLAVGSTEGADTVSTVTVLVAYHSVSGNTEKMAQAVSEGAKAVSGTKVVLKRTWSYGLVSGKFAPNRTAIQEWKSRLRRPKEIRKAIASPRINS